MSYKITPDLAKVITKLEEGYTIDSKIYTITVIRNSKGDAINAYDEIVALTAKSKDKEIDLHLDFYPQHERDKYQTPVKSMAVLPNTKEAIERAARDVFAAFLKLR